jgi:hypothetical protein
MTTEARILERIELVKLDKNGVSKRKEHHISSCLKADRKIADAV